MNTVSLRGIYRMLAEGMSIADIAEITGLLPSEVWEVSEGYDAAMTERESYRVAMGGGR